ncbi:hypothetical protein EV200_104297 [Pedobacter psychrotolerans]|uniref:Uncharacterized protein n=1 Tax=Pedobacter psychrotolerans TaxID=1843235 RepID=A0A4R2HG57_9SPHI|nr:hypothetical protein [Pedobacter psychrotolerans]TCO25260.1 hypothetical protein EV200_104297 [Pedobacter psychrotolerans]GGE46887.1 hypothetical protein GCM10011413_11220 [Pedobacter psychrotolerans]
MQTDNLITAQTEEKKTVLSWIVETNLPEADQLICKVFENDIFLYNINVIKSEINRNAQANEVIKTANVLYNYVSPDGFAIAMEDFGTRQEADEYFESWKKGFERQGYYSSTQYGRLQLDLLNEFCELSRYVED